MGRTCSTDGGKSRVFMGKPEGKRSLGRPRCMWKDSAKLNIEIGRVVWAVLIWLRIRAS
jgi:hypothetical protein